MSRIQNVLGGMCLVVLALGPGVAHAQYAPESTPQACSDQADNDGDGYVDCYDPDCAAQSFCQPAAPPPGYQQAPSGYQQPPSGYQPPPAGYQAPPPGYQQPPSYQAPPPGYQPPPPGYQPPPPGYQQPIYYAPPPSYAPPAYVARPVQPKTGIGELITGAVMLPLGIILLGVSSVPWQDAAYCSGDCAAGNIAAGVALDVFGSAFSVMGLIFIPVGIVKLAKFNRWKREHAPAAVQTSLLDRLEPVVSTGAGGGTVGLKLHF